MKTCNDLASMNHAATGSRCADEGLEVGQVWAYCTSVGFYGADDDLVDTKEDLIEFYSLVSRVSYKIARKPLGLGPKAARNYQFWHCAVTNAKTGDITTRVQRFPADMRDSGFRRVL